MKRELLLVSAIILATLVSCTKESELDQSIVSAMSAQTPIVFTTYTTDVSTTKGTAITTNNEFQTDGSFDVTSLVTAADVSFTYDEGATGAQNYTGFTFTPQNETAVKYFGLREVTYDGGWKNSSSMYWPNSSKLMHFAACSPSGILASEEDYTFSSTTSSGATSFSYSFDYTVDETVSTQKDLMYAITEVEYIAPADEEKANGSGYITEGATTVVDGVEITTNDEDPVNLHFKHALTQVAFTATKESGIKVFVKGVTLCNIYNNGKFTATKTTEDSDASAENDTVGDVGGVGDKVDADKFGSWTQGFNSEGWGWDTSLSDNLPSYITTTENVAGTFIFYYTSEGHTSISNYDAPLVEDDDDTVVRVTAPSGESLIEIGGGTTLLTSTSDVLMLMPQKLTAWTPTTSTGHNCIGYKSITKDESGNITSYGNFTTTYSSGAYDGSSTSEKSLSYLAIDCEIYHEDATEYEAAIHHGYIFVPFGDEVINYSSASVDGSVEDTSAWLPGYKITYCLNFGGGYIISEDDATTTIPVPGCIPDTKTYTLRPITYTVSVDAWVDDTDDTVVDLEEYESTTTTP